LNTAGRGGIFKKGETTNVIQQARIRKTKAFFEIPFFLRLLLPLPDLLLLRLFLLRLFSFLPPLPLVTILPASLLTLLPLPVFLPPISFLFNTLLFFLVLLLLTRARETGSGRPGDTRNVTGEKEGEEALRLNNLV
jgi:hypothetical protein